MSEIKYINSLEELTAITGGTNLEPFFLLKHSTRCPISSRAFEQYSIFAKKDNSHSFFVVLVVENRDVSNKVSEILQIQHESPQAFLITHEIQAFWHSSHGGITEESMEKALDLLKTK